MTGVDEDAVDELKDRFGDVDRDLLRRIAERIDRQRGEVTFQAVADVLDRLGQEGKIRERDYQTLARGGHLDLAPEDPLDNPPDHDPASDRNEQRGAKARGVINSQDFPQKAITARRSGDIHALVDVLNAANKWGNEALLHPNETSFPTDCNKAVNICVDGIKDQLDELARLGNDAKLRELAGGKLQEVHEEELREALVEMANAKRSLIGAAGTQYEQAREWVLDEDLSPFEVIKRADRVEAEFDVTYDQAKEIVQDAQALVEEAAEASQDLAERRQQLEEKVLRMHDDVDEEDVEEWSLEKLERAVDAGKSV